MSADRRAILLTFLEQNPHDAFARYGLAMEEVREGNAEAALEQFGLLMEQHPEYPAAYQQAGQLLISLNELERARKVLRQGVEAAGQQGNQHARSEMQGLLDEIGGE